MPQVLSALARLQAIACSTRPLDAAEVGAVLRVVGQYWQTTAVALTRRVAGGCEVLCEGVEQATLRDASPIQQWCHGERSAGVPRASLLPWEGQPARTLLWVTLAQDQEVELALVGLLPPSLEMARRITILQEAGAVASLLQAAVKGQHSEHSANSDTGLSMAQWQAVLGLHRSQDLYETAYRLANDGRLVLDCERVSVLLRKGRRYQVLAISGLATFDRRSPVLRRLEQLAADSLRAGERWEYPSREPLPPPLERLLEVYLDVNPAKQLRVLPLIWPVASPEDLEHHSASDAPPMAALVLENFRRTEWRATPVAERCFCESATMALHNAQAIARIPLHAPLQALGQLNDPMRRSWPRRLLWLVTPVLVAAILWWPVPFHITAAGTLQPVQRVGVFAPSHGIVREVLVDHGQQVEQHAVVIRMENAELEQQQEMLLGEIQLAREQLDSLAPLRLDPLTARDPAAANRLASDERRLRTQRQSLEEQLALVKRQLDELEIRSPLAGTILTWDVQHQLTARPVERGQRLLTVASSEGEWQLELLVDDKDMAHVRQAAQASTKPLPASYYLGTEPEKKLVGEVAVLGTFAEPGEQADRWVHVRVDIDEGRLTTLLPGVRVQARIECGRRRLGYAWFRGLIDFVQAKILFPLR